MIDAKNTWSLWCWHNRRRTDVYGFARRHDRRSGFRQWRTTGRYIQLTLHWCPLFERVNAWSDVERCVCILVRSVFGQIKLSARLARWRLHLSEHRINRCSILRKRSTLKFKFKLNVQNSISTFKFRMNNFVDEPSSEWNETRRSSSVVKPRALFCFVVGCQSTFSSSSLWRFACNEPIALWMLALRQLTADFRTVALRCFYVYLSRFNQREQYPSESKDGCPTQAAKTEI